MRKAGENPELLVLEELEPDLHLTMPEAQVHRAWLQKKRTGGYWDDNLPPELQDAELRSNVENYEWYWDYLMASIKRDFPTLETLIDEE